MITATLKYQKRTEELRRHYDALATQEIDWYQRNRFFHDKLLRYYQFLIPIGSSVLELGCGKGHLVGNLSASEAVGVDVSAKMLERAKETYPQVDFICADVEEFQTDRTFDYIIISGTLASVANIQSFLQNLRKMTTPNTRVIITYYNELWGPLLQWGERAGLKMPELIYNWLSIDDISNFLELTNYQIVRRNFLLLFPKNIPLVSFIFNKILSKFPVIRRLSLVHTVVARCRVPPEGVPDLTCSVVLTCRDEEENIEGLVHEIPNMGKHTEIIFVEGHSTDNTVGKIKEMMHKYPEKDIKLLKQEGFGQADAYRLGFQKAKGDLLCWLEADLTIPPSEISLFWDAFISGKGEYINGTRLIYEMEKEAMPFLNLIGNRFFGNIFTMILEQRFTDTLCGFKAISKVNYERIRKQSNYFGDFDPFGDFELIFGAMKLCLKGIEIPVHYRLRTYGRSKAYGHTFASFIKHGLLLLRMSWIAFKKFLFY